MRASFFLFTYLLFLFVRVGQAEIFFVLENPAPNQTLSGVGAISGWVFSCEPDAHVTVRLWIDGAEASEIPCCIARADVAQEFSDFPQALTSGFGQVFNFNLLSEGTHTIVVEFEDDAGSLPQMVEQTITTVKPGGFEFLQALDLFFA